MSDESFLVFVSSSLSWFSCDDIDMIYFILVKVQITLGQAATEFQRYLFCSQMQQISSYFVVWNISVDSQKSFCWNHEFCKLSFKIKTCCKLFSSTPCFIHQMFWSALPSSGWCLRLFLVYIYAVNWSWLLILHIRNTAKHYKATNTTPVLNFDIKAQVE